MSRACSQCPTFVLVKHRKDLHKNIGNEVSYTVLSLVKKLKWLSIKCSLCYKLNARINLLIDTITSATYSQLVAWARSYHLYQDHVNPL